MVCGPLAETQETAGDSHCVLAAEGKARTVLENQNVIERGRKRHVVSDGVELEYTGGDAPPTVERESFLELPAECDSFPP